MYNTVDYATSLITIDLILNHIYVYITVDLILSHISVYGTVDLIFVLYFRSEPQGCVLIFLNGNKFLKQNKNVLRRTTHI